MQNSAINASLSTQSLTFRPGGPSVSFEVILSNDSDQFANFQLEVLAAGESRSSEYRWYSLSPEVAAAKPPGSSTQFIVVIFNTPLPGFVGTVNLTVRVFSPQLRQERRLLVRLKIEPDNRPTLLSVDLPVQRLQVYPRNFVDIPVRVRNLGQQPVDVVLHFAGLDSSWLINSAQRRLFVNPGGQAETTFQCQPPAAIQAPSQDYPFTIEATSRDGFPASTTGCLEVLPVGFVEFTASPQQQKIPSQGRWWHNWQSNLASFELLFKNASNLQQQVTIQLRGRDHRKLNFKIFPEVADLSIGETTKVLLEVRTKRPWVGWGKTLQIEAKSILSDQRLGSTDPATQNLELQVLPVLLWLQMVLIALLTALLALIFRHAPITHTDSVNAVRFSGDALSVVSGSDDCTLRRWRINAGGLEPEGTLLEKSPIACGKRQNPQGLLAVTNRAVRALRFMPEDSNRVAAGLENGVIELWDVPTGQRKVELKDQNDPTKGKDRVFDLVFTKDSRYLFSGYGSGRVRVWVRSSLDSEFQPNPEQILDIQGKLKRSYQVQALALSPDQKTLVIAGSYKSFILWEWNSQSGISVQKPSGGQGDYIYGLAFAPSSPNLLATSDAYGEIKIWDLNQCQVTKTPNQQDEPIEKECEERDRWSAGKMAVRSLAFSEDGRQLVSAGDDGRVVVWYLTSEGKLDKKIAVADQEIYTTSKNLNSIDLKTVNQGTMIVVGGDDFQVQLRRIN